MILVMYVAYFISGFMWAWTRFPERKASAFQAWMAVTGLLVAGFIEGMRQEQFWAVVDCLMAFYLFLTMRPAPTM